ncbi:spore germination protein [Paenibacillus chartarius]|uniref:Spore germination protein n=1 Tax=Paenibacillus chartarius TaxID=747481 RepID=A0ABV6DV01_9BACL
MDLFKLLGKSQLVSSADKASRQASRDIDDPASGPVTITENKVDWLREQLGDSPDIIFRSLGDTLNADHCLTVVYIDGLVDQQLLTMMLDALAADSTSPCTVASHLENLLMSRLPVGSLKRIDNDDKLLQSVLDGQVVVLPAGHSDALVVSIMGGVRRSVEEPSSQTVIRGPKEGFVEELATNIALLRRKIRSPQFRYEPMVLGKYTQTKVAVCYLEGIADPVVVSEVTKRLASINTDSILESGYIEEFIQDGVYTPFPTILNSERPDAVAGGILEGLVAILVDGTPFVLLAPVSFFRFFISSEDYYQRFDISTFLRLVRISSFAVALLLPSIFIAITTFHQEMLPTTLLVSLAAQRESTPLPALLEALLMELTFEVIREAGVRMPRAIGPAISIVGALVLGQAAVQAGLVSAAMVIVVSFTAISNFVLPAINMASAVRLMRFVLMLLAGTLGLYGILAGLVPTLVHLISLRTFGVPYFLPIAPFMPSNMKDLLVRMPWWKMQTRPAMIAGDNQTRQGPVLKPGSQRIHGDRNEDSAQ